MMTYFLSAEIPLEESPLQLQQAIEAELQRWGEPLRWAITSVDNEAQIAQVEAIITVESESILP